MTESDQLREQMWDLVYGLLEPEESRSLISRIKSDPKAARLYAEVRLQADLVGQASCIEDLSLALEAPGGAVKPMPAKVQKRIAGADAVAAAGVRSHSRSSSRLVAAVATALAVLLAVGHFWPQPNEMQIAAGFVVTDFESPSAINAGLTNKFALRTYHLNSAGQPAGGVPATVDLAIRGRTGEALLQRQVVTGDDGRGVLEVPGTALEPGVRLEIGPTQGKYADAAPADTADAEAGTSGESLEVASLALELPVRQEPQVTYFLLEQQVAEPGKPLNFACWSFNSFSGKPAPEETSRVAIENFAGAALTTPMETVRREFNVVSGVLQPPPGASPAPAAGALAYQFGAEAKKRAAGGASVGQRGAGVTAPGAAPAAVGLQQQLNEPLAEAAKPAAAAPAKESQPSPTNLAAEPARTAPGQAGGESLLRGAQPQTPTVPAGAQLAVEVPIELAGKPVVAEAISRGIAVTTVPLSSEKQKAGLEVLGDKKNATQSVKLDVPPEADGKIDVALIDQASVPPQVVHQQSFYREPSRRLQIDLPNIKERFALGERVQLVLQVTDEAGQPAANTLIGVRVWNDAVVKQTAEQPVLLESAVREGLRGAVFLSDEKELEKLSKLGRAVEDERAGASRQEQSLASIRLSNLDVVQSKFNAAVAEAQGRRQAIVQSIGTVVFIGGLLLAVALGVLAMRRVLTGLQVMAPAVAIAVASLLIGLVWVGPLSPPGQSQIAMTPEAAFSEKSAETYLPAADANAGLPQLAQAQPTAPAGGYVVPAPAQGLAKDRDLERGGAAFGGLGAAGAPAEGKGLADRERRLEDDSAGRSLARQAPAALYFNPQLLTDAGGRATIEFVMPPVESEYRLLIDALGHGRIGSKQHLIVGRAADGK